MRIGVIGLGLIGGSLLRALAALGAGSGGAAVRLSALGYDRDPVTRVAARNAGLDVADDPAALVAPEVDVLVLAVPLTVLDGLAPLLSGFRGLLTDVTSVKGPVRELVRTMGKTEPSSDARFSSTAKPDGSSSAGFSSTASPTLRFVGGHPMAGKETSGFGASDPGLFTDRVWALCLDEDTDLADWLTLAGLYTRLGARVVPTTTEAHDAAVAAVSHLPHLLAGALAVHAADPLAAALAAGSFRDGTRVAGSSPDLVAAMCGGNAPAVRVALDAALDSLNAARTALDAPDPVAAVRAWFAPAHAVRSHWPPRSGPVETLPVNREELLDLGGSGGWVHSLDGDGAHVSVVRTATIVP